MNGCNAQILQTCAGFSTNRLHFHYIRNKAKVRPMPRSIALPSSHQSLLAVAYRRKVAIHVPLYKKIKTIKQKNKTEQNKTKQNKTKQTTRKTRSKNTSQRNSQNTGKNSQ